jgi:nucleotide-binding universal stress UspA family protein
MYGKILVAHSGSPGASRALAGARELARRIEVDLAIICVEQLPRFPTRIGEIAGAQADAASIFEKVIASAAKFARAQVVGSNLIFSLGIPCRPSSNSCGAADIISWSPAM